MKEVTFDCLLKFLEIIFKSKLSSCQALVSKLHIVWTLEQARWGLGYSRSTPFPRLITVSKREWVSCDVVCGMQEEGEGLNNLGPSRSLSVCLLSSSSSRERADRT